MSLLDPKSVTFTARASSFFAACAVALVSGTPYLYSTYGNQLTTKLELTAIQSNVLFSAVSSTVVVLGRLSLTYSGQFYSFGFFMAFLFLVLIGMGSQAGYMTSVSTNAHNFQSARGVAMGVPIALFGLSALLFAQINNLFYKEDTQAFLLLVAKAIGGTILFSILFLTVFPALDVEDDVRAETAAMPARIEVGNSVGYTVITSPREDPEDLGEDAEDRRRRTQERERLLQVDQAGHARNPTTTLALGHKIPSGYQLFKTTHVAQMLLLSVLFLAGPCLMYVANAGNIIRSIYRDHMDDPSVPPTDEELIRLQQLQNFHVSLISLCSCLGRISVGMLSDVGKRGAGQWWGIKRIGFMLYAGVCVWIGQTAGFRVENIKDLTLVSLLVGLGYGSVFGVAPTIVSEWFGVNNFGTNW
ncbi:hypothetical protein BGZ83_002682 [Gryganskiella cystojenkinii]|nr:hypothetical protein BGZ83_002682 [Gryganskiella cystojenkinii]